MSSWEELRVVLRELTAARPSPIRQFPSPDTATAEPPFRILLAPWALDVAQGLDARFGHDVVLTVGFLRYPSPEPPDRLSPEGAPPPASHEPLLDESVEVRGVQPFVVRSGHDLESELSVTNRGPAPLVIQNWGKEIGRVLDRATGEVVGGFAGSHVLLLVRFAAAPGEAVTVPLLVGTASYRRSLGYAVPPGEWAVEVVLDLGTGRRRRAPSLPLQVVK